MCWSQIHNFLTYLASNSMPRKQQIYIYIYIYHFFFFLLRINKYIKVNKDYRFGTFQKNIIRLKTKGTITIMMIIVI